MALRIHQRETGGAIVAFSDGNQVETLINALLSSLHRGVGRSLREPLRAFLGGGLGEPLFGSQSAVLPEATMNQRFPGIGGEK